MFRLFLFEVIEMKIAVVFTGGTIGSKSGVSIDPDKEQPYKLLSICPDDVSYDVFEPYTILSEYLTGTHINMLLDCVGGLLCKDYDGIIVTHGTDTIQYSAAALGYAFAECNIPIMLVGAQYVLDNPDTNGFDNFIDSVEFIRQRLGTGVFVCYRNSDGRHYVHRGVRLLSAEAYSDDLKSVCNMYYGEFARSGFIKNSDYREKIERQLNGVHLNEYCKRVLCAESRPGLGKCDIPDCVESVLLSSYHCGTVNTDSNPLLNAAKQKQIPVYLTGSKADVRYESASHFKSLGVVPLPQMSPLAAYIKLWMISDSGLDSSLMFKNIGDFINF